MDPLQPKVTVVGNVDPQILIKKLSKAGKQAEIWSQIGNENAGVGRRGGAPKTEEKGNPNNGSEKAKYQEFSCIASDRSSITKETTNSFVEEKSTKAPNLVKDQSSITKKGGEINQINLIPTSTYTRNCSVHQKTLPVETVDQVRKCTRPHDVADPYSNIMRSGPYPHYAIPSSYVTAPVIVKPTPTCNAKQQNYSYARAVYPFIFPDASTTINTSRGLFQ